MSFANQGTPIQNYRLFDFSGGLNTTDHKYNLAPNEASDLLNVDLFERGNFKQRAGVTINSEYKAPTGTRIKRFHQFIKLDGTTENMAFYYDDNKQLAGVYATDGTNQYDLSFMDGTTQITLSKQPINFFTWNNTLYIVTTSGVFKYGGGGVNAEKVAGLEGCKYAIVFHNRVFYAGFSNAPDMVKFSQLYNPDSIDTVISSDSGTSTLNGGGEIAVRSEKGDVPVTGLTIFLNSLIIFKSDSVFSLRGYNPDTDFQLSPINVSSGCTHPETIAQANNGVYYLSHDGVYLLATPYEGYIATKKISQKVDKTIQASNEEIDMIHGTIGLKATYYENKYYLATENHTFVYDEKLAVWTRYDIKMSALYKDFSSDMLVFASNQEYALSFNPSKYDDEYTPGTLTPIHSTYSIGYNYFEFPELTKRYRYLKVFFKPFPVSNAKIDLKIEIDYKNSSKEIDAEYTSFVWGESNWGDAWYGDQKESISEMVRFGGNGEAIRFTFSNQELGQGLEVHGLVAGFKMKKRVR